MTVQDPSSNEVGLTRSLGTSQLTMIGIGGAIGTGLFLGSGVAIGYAGPGVVLSYIIAAGIAGIVMFSLSEMAVAHPTAGSFGTYAEIYLSGRAAFVVRYTYWAAQTTAMGGDAIAIGHYLNFWWPDWGVWIGALISGCLVTILNCRPVANFGKVEFALSSIKVIAIVVFILFGLAIIFGIGIPALGFTNYSVHGGPFPHGMGGVWSAVMVAVLSFVGIEIIAVTAGEAKDPKHAVPSALRHMLIRLLLFYGLGVAIVVAIVPWDQAGATLVADSPFVKVFRHFSLPFSATAMNIVVITAALSSMNALLYMSGRILFSLGRAGQGPRSFGVVNQAGVPVNAILVSSLGLAFATMTAMLSPAAYNYLIGIALFGAIWTWCVILLTHIRFRRIYAKDKLAALGVRAPFAPALQWIGLALLLAIYVTMAMDTEFWNVAIIVGVPWIVALSILYRWVRAEAPARSSPRATLRPGGDSP